MSYVFFVLSGVFASNLIPSNLRAVEGTEIERDRICYTKHIPFVCPTWDEHAYPTVLHILGRSALLYLQGKLMSKGDEAKKRHGGTQFHGVICTTKS